MPFADSANADKSAAKGRKKGAEAKKKAKQNLLPSQTFDWDKALALHRKTIIEIYGPPETWDWEGETADETEETA